MNSKIQLRQVEFIPKNLEPGILYVSERFNVAAHICPCGCSTKIVTPLGPCEWSFSTRNGKATLSPSIGNWQIPCQSHYWITDGEIEWSYQWSEERIKSGQRADRSRLEAYYQKKERGQKKSFWKKIRDRLFGESK